MNLLLLLSALLSALAGAHGGRALDAPVTVTRAVEAAAEVGTVSAAEVHRPAVVTTRRPRAGMARANGWRLDPAEPIYLSRRRE